MASAAIKEHEDFKEMELWEHLAELRTRIIRSFWWIVLGLIVAWCVYGWLYQIIDHPFEAVKRHHPTIQWLYMNFTGPFMLQLKISLIGGLILALPLITMEVWGFVAPGLTRNEKKACRIVFPLSIVFFGLGVFCGYLCMEPALEWFAGFIPPGAGVIQDPSHYLTFMAWMLLAFGIAFQLPLVLMLFTFIGLLPSKALRDHWRIAIVACIIVGAVATPGGDLVSPVILGGALVALYFVSIFLCAMVERFARRGQPSSA